MVLRADFRIMGREVFPVWGLTCTDSVVGVEAIPTLHGVPPTGNWYDHRYAPLSTTSLELVIVLSSRKEGKTRVGV